MTKLRHKLFIPAYCLLISLYLVLGIASCTRSQAETKDVQNKRGAISTNENTLINPGNRIGKITIGTQPESLSYLGDPDLSDSAMGKSWMTWYSKNSHSISGKYELNIFTSYTDPELTRKEVRCIRVTSPDFRTANGISTTVDSSSIFKVNPNFKFIGTYSEKSNMPPVAVYADAITGLAIELDRSDKKCCAVIIFSPNRGLMPDYGYFRPDLKQNKRG